MHNNFTHDAARAERLFKVTLFLALGIAVIRGVATALSVESVFDLSSNDDIMRMMSVRNWRDGQSWFDMTQYQLLAPDGVSLHWSRYIDFGIGALVWIFGIVMPAAMAEQWAAAVWPLCLLAALVMVVGFGTRRVLGPLAAAIAMLSVVLYPPTSVVYFAIGRVDHHNMQILLVTVSLLAMIIPNRPVLFGAVAGIAAAASLAIGLETLFFVATIGILHVVKAAIFSTKSRARLAAFCVSIAISSLVFFVGQTAPHDWFVTQCDKLSVPYLLICGIGAGSGLAALVVHDSKKYPAVFIATVAIVAIILLIISWPVITPCLQAPYANLPQIAQTFINEHITEALPLHVYAARNPLSFLQYFGPAITALIAATVIWLRQQYLGRPAEEIWQILLFGWIGLLACIFQSRQIVLLAAVTPFLTGYAVRPALQSYFDARTGTSRILLWTAVTLTLFQPLLSSTLIGLWKTSPLRPSFAASKDVDVQPTQASGALDENCDNLQTLALLNTLPPARVLSSLNLGPRLIMATHHIGMAAPYHRSADAIINGFIPLSGTTALLTQTFANQAIDYVVVCRASNYGDANSIGTRLASGETVPGFEAVTLDHPDLMIFRRTSLE